MMVNCSDNDLRAVEENYKLIRERINEAAVKSGRAPEDITFLAATKTVSPEKINHAISCGLSAIGENRVQELLDKYNAYDLTHCDLQFIGRLQSNKIKYIIDKVSQIQSVDSIAQVKEISKQAIKHGLTMKILIEVNVGAEESKGGIMPDALSEFIHEASEFKGVFVNGLMAIPPICSDNKRLMEYFSNMTQYYVDISGKKLDNVSMNILSMGMSSDYYEAILCGANMVRIGSSLFGQRIYNK